MTLLVDRPACFAEMCHCPVRTKAVAWLIGLSTDPIRRASVQVRQQRGRPDPWVAIVARKRDKVSVADIRGRRAPDRGPQYAWLARPPSFDNALAPRLFQPLEWWGRPLKSRALADRGCRNLAVSIENAAQWARDLRVVSRGRAPTHVQAPCSVLRHRFLAVLPFDQAAISKYCHLSFQEERA